MPSTPTLLSFSPVDWLLVAGYFLLLLLLGLRGSRSDAGDATSFLLSGRRLTLPAFVAALVSTWYGGILGVGEFTWRYGISNWLVFGAPYYVFALIFAFALARTVRESSAFSIPDALARVYDTRTALFGAALVFFISSPAPYVLMQAVLLQVVTGWPLILCLFLGAAASMLYMTVGGFQSVVKVDLVQFTLMFAGFALVLAFLIPAYGITPFIPDHVPAAHMDPSGGHSWQFILVWFFIALWTLIAPQFHQFTLSASSPRVARKGIVVSVVFWMLFDAMTTLTGLYARALLPSLPDPAMAYPALADSVLPPLAKGLFFLGMLATVMSTTDGLTFISAATLGRDMAARISGRFDDARVRLYTRIGIGITLCVAIAGALVFPSVISLWYAIGTLFIPGLLLPVLSVYLPRWRMSASRTFTAMILSSAASFVSFILGHISLRNGLPQYPFSIEPMYAGLAISAILYALPRPRGGVAASG